MLLALLEGSAAGLLVKAKGGLEDAVCLKTRGGSKSFAIKKVKIRSSQSSRGRDAS
jgi:hypothetical protein